MRCRAARRSILETTLRAGRSLLPSDVEKHLRTCASCAAEAREGRRLVADLERLRTEVPFPVDVTGRVMARLLASDASHPELSRSRIGFLVAAVLAAAAATTWVLLGHLPLLQLEVGRLWAVAGGMATALAEIARPARHVARALGTLGLHAWTALSPLVSQVARSAPSYQSVALAAVLAMTSATALVVRRDLRRDARPAEKES